MVTDGKLTWPFNARTALEPARSRRFAFRVREDIRDAPTSGLREAQPNAEYRDPFGMGKDEGAPSDRQVREDRPIGSHTTYPVGNSSSGRSGPWTARLARVPNLTCRDTDGSLCNRLEQTGACKVRLPFRVKVSAARPVNLRGEPPGRPIPVRGGKFVLALRPFAPQSFILEP
jgi:hypothetical protein